MKKNLVIFVALLTVIAVAMPAFALEVKYGGLFRTRLVSNNNITDGNDDLDDNQNYIDQRLRMFFTFISSENLRAVFAFEQDVLWGDSRAKVWQGHRDVIGLELKHAYVDFAIPTTPVRMKVGLQPIAVLTGWILDEDFTAATATAKFDPITVTLGYVGERNNFVRNEDENIDDVLLAATYAAGPISASVVGLYQDGHDAGSAGLATNYFVNPIAPFGDDDNLFDLGLTFSYKQDFWNFTFNYVQNLGSFEDATGEDINYRGFMLEAIGNFFCGPWSFTLGGFYTSGEDFLHDDDDDFDAFVYPVGNDHHWAEILGAGTLDAAIDGGAGVADGPVNRGGYSANVRPSNMWTVNAGAAYQVLEGTKLTLNYYYAGTAEDVVSGVGEEDDSIGHEFDLYVDQRIVDKLMLRLVGAYLFAGDGYTFFDEDDDAYEVGAQLSWSF